VIESKEGTVVFSIDREGQVHYHYQGQPKVCKGSKDMALALAEALKTLVVTYKKNDL
jgi:hypothetical protein